MLDPSAVGDLVARLHRCAPASDEPVGAWFAAGLGEESWQALDEQVTAHGAPFAEDLARLLPDLVAVESVIEPHASPIVCHRDLWADNVLPDERRTPVGGRLREPRSRRPVAGARDGALRVR